MWERAEGIRSPGCGSPKRALTSRGLGPLRLGDDWQTLLRRAGQPQQRTRAWSWCVDGAGNRHAADIAVLTDAGTVQLVGSTARGRSAARVAVGAHAARDGLRVVRARRVAWVYDVRGGRVSAVAVASRSLVRRPGALRAAMARLRSAEATQVHADFVPSAAQATASRLTGRALAGSLDPRLNAALALLCHLQVQGS
jgi:hypothetical protein